MTALIVAEHVPDRSQRERYRTVDASEKPGRMQDNDRLALSAPILTGEPDTVDIDMKSPGRVAARMFHGLHNTKPRAAI